MAAGVVPAQSALCAVASGMTWACLKVNRGDLGTSESALSVTIPRQGTLNGRPNGHVLTEFGEEAGVVDSFWLATFRVDKTVVALVHVNVPAKKLFYEVWDDDGSGNPKNPENGPIYTSPVVPLMICDVGY